MNWVDYAILAVIVISVLTGYLKGFILSLFSFAGYLAAAISAKIFSPKLADILAKSTSINDKIHSFMDSRLASLGIPTGSGFSTSMAIPQNMDKLILQDPELKKMFSQNPILLNLLKQNSQAGAGQTIIDMLVSFVLTIVSVIIIFIVVKITVSIIAHLINRGIRKSPTLNSANRTAGLIFGGLAGVILVLIIITVISPFVISSGQNGFAASINNSRCVQLFYESKLYQMIMGLGLLSGK